MAQVLVTDTYLSDIADAIRGKLSSNDTYTPAEMAGAIDDIQTGSNPTLITKSITANGTYNASGDNADGYSQVVVEVQSSSSGLEPFDTYEFNVPSDINYQDSTGTSLRTLATLTFNQATLTKVAQYSSISVSDNPFAIAGCARVLFSVQPKSKTLIAADSTYIKNIRKDTVTNLKIQSGNIVQQAPFWRARWSMNTNGSLVYAGVFATSNENHGFNIAINNGQLLIQTQLSQNGGQMISAGDYVVKLYDITGTVIF